MNKKPATLSLVLRRSHGVQISYGSGLATHVTYFPRVFPIVHKPADFFQKTVQEDVEMVDYTREVGRAWKEGTKMLVDIGPNFQT